MRTIRRKVFIFEQQLNDSFWDWDEEDKLLLQHWKENKKKIFALIYSKIKEYDDFDDEKLKVALIVHDKDVSYGTKLVEPHIHGYIEFSYRHSLNGFAKALGIESQYVEGVSQGKYGKINSLAYLIHAKDKTKYQYSSEEVETFGTFNYDEFIKQNKEDFDKRAATAKREQSDIGLDYVLQEVQQGHLTYRDVIIDEDLAFLYANNQVKFKDAFNFYGERRTWLRLEELRNKEYELTVIYIQGKPGIGKTTLANELALETRSLLMANGYKSDIYSAGAKNSFDDYYGEDILILDDLRYDSLSCSDWLKIFDPLNSARMSARYRNKLVVPKLIIVANYLSPENFFGQIPNEDLNQFIRRLNYKSEIKGEDFLGDIIKTYCFSEIELLGESYIYSISELKAAQLKYGAFKVFQTDNKQEFVKRLISEYISKRILKHDLVQNI